MFSVRQNKLNFDITALLRFSFFILVNIFTEYFIWNQCTVDFQMKANLLLFAMWMSTVEIIMKKKRFIRLHPRNYWSAFMIPLIVNLIIGILTYKYVSIYAVTSIINTMIVTMLIDAEAGVLSTIIYSSFFGVLFGYDIRFFTIFFLPGVLVALASRRISRRIEIIYSFIASSLGQAGMLYLFTFGDKNIYQEYISIIMSNFINVLIAIGLLPFIEYITRVYSDIGLLELGNLNHPLLKKLSMVAPGTYYHSMVISNMIDLSAEAIGGRTTLARVGAYFHDIGKMWNPEFFTENQRGKNPHEKISPKLSSLILDKHIRHGKELAQKHRLPILIEDMIEQHQGTRVKKFFYNKYAEITGKKEPDLFRYPGPIPLFKESALLMMCDIIEAISRTSTDLSYSSIEKTLDSLVESLYFEGQFDDCGLKIKEIHKAKEKIIEVILAMNHKRITYPDVNKKELG